MDAVQDVLRPLGITRCYRGYFHTLTAISLALENEDRLCSVVKDIYGAIAVQYNCSWSAVERNIRTVVRRAWQVNPKLLEQMAGYPLDGPPAASQFLEIVVTFLQRSSP